MTKLSAVQKQIVVNLLQQRDAIVAQYQAQLDELVRLIGAASGIANPVLMPQDGDLVVVEHE